MAFLLVEIARLGIIGDANCAEILESCVEIPEDQRTKAGHPRASSKLLVPSLVALLPGSHLTPDIRSFDHDSGELATEYGS